MQWRPIETAPRDETPILLYFPGRGPLEPAGNGAPHGCIEGWHFSSPKGIDDGWETVIGSIGEPTHWMPLPEPPQ